MNKITHLILASFFLNTCIQNVRLDASSKIIANEYCSFRKVNSFYTNYGKERFYQSCYGLKCDITKSEFTYDFLKNKTVSYSIIQKIKNFSEKSFCLYQTLEFCWSKGLKKASLNRQFN